MLQNLFQTIKRRRTAARTRRELAALDPATLRDLGITRTEIARVANDDATARVPLARTEPAGRGVDTGVQRAA